MYYDFIEDLGKSRFFILIGFLIVDKKNNKIELYNCNCDIKFILYNCIFNVKCWLMIYI